MEKIHVHQSLAKAVAEHGVKTMFGLMGDANLFLVDSFVRDCGGQFVPAAHEASSVLMALAYTQVTGKIGPPDGDANAIPALGQRAHNMASNKAGPAEDRDELGLIERCHLCTP